MEKLQKQIEVSLKERMNELIKASENFIEKQSEDVESNFYSEMTFMRDMINDIEELVKVYNAISNQQELLELDGDEKEEYLEELFESELAIWELSAKRGYKKFIEERSFEDE